MTEKSIVTRHVSICLNQALKQAYVNNPISVHKLFLVYSLHYFVTRPESSKNKTKKNPPFIRHWLNRRTTHSATCLNCYLLKQSCVLAKTVRTSQFIVSLLPFELIQALTEWLKQLMEDDSRQKKKNDYRQNSPLGSDDRKVRID